MNHIKNSSFSLILVITAEKTTPLIILHKQIFCLRKDCIYKTCENLFKGQFVQSTDKHVYFFHYLMKEWIVVSV